MCEEEVFSILCKFSENFYLNSLFECERFVFPSNTVHVNGEYYSNHLKAYKVRMTLA